MQMREAINLDIDDGFIYKTAHMYLVVGQVRVDYIVYKYVYRVRNISR